MTHSQRKIGALAGVAGAGFALLVSAIGRYAAEAAVRVRPNLADVGFLDALLANHPGDWLFYHYPMAMTLGLTVVFAAIFSFGVTWVTADV